MSRKRQMLRALHYNLPKATVNEAFEWGWKHGQGKKFALTSAWIHGTGLAETARTALLPKLWSLPNDPN